MNKLRAFILAAAFGILAAQTPVFAADPIAVSPWLIYNALPDGQKPVQPSSSTPKPVRTTGHAMPLLLLVQTSDYAPTYTRSAFMDSYFGSTTVASGRWPFDSLNNFYSRSSYGQFDFSAGYSSSWISLGNARSGYVNRESIVSAALTASGIDTSSYDTDGDGYIDYLIVVMSGSKKPLLSTWEKDNYFGTYAGTQPGGKKIGKYFFTFESQSDTYSTPMDVTQAIKYSRYALGLPQIMLDSSESTTITRRTAGGATVVGMNDTEYDLNPFFKYLLGWITPYNATTTQSVTVASYTATTLPDGSHYAVRAGPPSASDLFSEYFLYTYHRNTSAAQNDIRMDSSGDLMYHVNASLNITSSAFANDNFFTPEPLVQLVPITPRTTIETAGNLISADFGTGAPYGFYKQPSLARYGNMNSPFKIDPNTLNPRTVAISTQIGLPGQITSLYASQGGSNATVRLSWSAQTGAGTWYYELLHATGSITGENFDTALQSLDFSAGWAIDTAVNFTGKEAVASGASTPIYRSAVRKVQGPLNVSFAWKYTGATPSNAVFLVDGKPLAALASTAKTTSTVAVGSGEHYIQWRALLGSGETLTLDNISYSAAQLDWNSAESLFTNIAESAVTKDTAELPRADGALHSFALRARDSTASTYDSYGPISNIASRTDIYVPAKPVVTALTGESEGKILVYWPVPANNIYPTAYSKSPDGNMGPGSSFCIKYSTRSTDLSNMDNCTSIPATMTWNYGSGGNVVTTLTGLLPDKLYYIKVRAQDETGNISAVSDAAQAKPPADITAPNPVTNLTAAKGFSYLQDDTRIDVPGSVMLSFNVTGNDGDVNPFNSGSGIAIQTATIANATWSHLNATPYNLSTPLSAGWPLSYLVTGLDEATTYYFSVYLMDESGNWSTAASTVSMRPTLDSIAPGNITSLTLLTGPNQGQVHLRWSASGDDGYDGTISYGRYCVIASVNNNPHTGAECTGSAITGNTIEYTGQPVVISTSGVSPDTNLALTMTGLTPDTTYYFSVFTRDDSDHWSTSSNRPSIMAYNEAPSSVKNLAAAKGSTEGQITLTWSAPGEDGLTGTITDGKYYVDYSTYSGAAFSTTSINAFSKDLTGTASGSPLTETLSGFTPGRTYYFAVWTLDGENKLSGISNIASSVPKEDTTAPAAINSLAAAKGLQKGEVKLSWTIATEDGTQGDVIDSGGFCVAYATYPGYAINTATCLGTLPANYRYITVSNKMAGDAMSQTIVGLSTTTLYYFKVRQHDAAVNWSPNSNEPSVIPQTLNLIPNPVDDVTVAAGTNEGDAILRWTMPGDDENIGTITNGRFRISYKTVNTGWDVASYQVDASTTVNPGDAAAYTVTGLTANQLYYFKVWVRDAEEDHWSNTSTVTVSGKPKDDLIAPAPAYDLAFNSVVSGTGTFSWKVSGDNGNSGTLGTGSRFIVTRTSMTFPAGTQEPRLADGEAAQEIKYVAAAGYAPGATASAAFSATPGRAYMFSVQIEDDRGNISAVSSAPFRLYSSVPNPLKLTAVPGTDEGTIMLSLVISGDNGLTGPITSGAMGIAYDVQDRTSAWAALEPQSSSDFNISFTTSALVQGSTSTITLTGLTNNNRYYFSAWLRNSQSNWSQASVSAAGQNTAVANGDISPPTSVTNFTAEKAGSENSVLLSWDCPSDNSNGGSLDPGANFLITYSTDPLAVMAQLPVNSTVPVTTLGYNQAVPPGTRMYYNVAGLSGGTTYYFLMRTMDEAGNISAVSPNVPSARAGLNRPKAITDLTAVKGTDEGDIVLAWTAPGRYDDTGVITAGFYYLTCKNEQNDYCVTPAGTWNNMPISILNLAPGTAESRTYSGFSPGKLYTFTIKTENQDPTVSYVSNAASAYPKADELEPGTVIDLAISQSGEALVFNWSAPGDDHLDPTKKLETGSAFCIAYSTADAPVFSTSGCAGPDAGYVVLSTAARPVGERQTFVVYPAIEEEEYTAVIWHHDELNNWSDISNTATYTVPDLIPPAVTAFAAQGNSSGVRLSWNYATPTDFKEFVIYRASGSFLFNCTMQDISAGLCVVDNAYLFAQTTSFFYDDTHDEYTSYRYAVTATDGGASVQKSSAVFSDITNRTDTTAPTCAPASASHPSQTGWYSSTTLSIAWNCADNTGGSGIFNRYYRITSSTVTAPSQNELKLSGQTTAASQSAALTEGLWTLWLAAEDAQNNLSPVYRFDVNVATTPPTAAFTMQSRQLTSGRHSFGLTITSKAPVSSTPTVACTLADSSQVALTLAGSGSSWSGEFVLGPSVAEGTAAFSFSMTDDAGNIGSFITAGSTFTVRHAVYPENGGTAFNGTDTTLTVPPGAAPNPVQIAIAAVAESSAPITSANDNISRYDAIAPIPGLGLYREFNATDITDNSAVTSFNRRITVSITYPDSNNDGFVDGTGVKAEELRIFWLDTTVNRWTMLADSAVNTASKTVTGTTDHFSLFGVMRVTQLSSSIKNIIAYPQPCKMATDRFVTLAPLPDYSDTRVYIYSAGGQLVRKLDLDNGGIVRQGVLQAQWDGRNDSGDKVASGIYVYMLKSPDGAKSGSLGILW